MGRFRNWWLVSERCVMMHAIGSVSNSLHYYCRSAASPEEAATPWDAFAIGSLAAGAVHAHEDFGVTVDLEADENVVGLISPGQV